MSVDFTEEAERLAKLMLDSPYGPPARAGMVAEHLRAAYERGYRYAQRDLRIALGFDEGNLIGLVQ